MSSMRTALIGAAIGAAIVGGPAVVWIADHSAPVAVAQTPSQASVVTVAPTTAPKKQFRSIKVDKIEIDGREAATKTDVSAAFKDSPARIVFIGGELDKVQADKMPDDVTAWMNFADGAHVSIRKGSIR